MTALDLEALALKLGFAFEKDLSKYPYVNGRMALIPYGIAKQKNVLPLGEKEGKLLLALSDPYDLEVIEEVRCRTDKEIIEILAPLEAIQEALSQCYQQKEGATSELIAGLEESQQQELLGEEGYDLLDQEVDSPIIQLLNSILREAIQERASDIHFEPGEEGIEVRYRIDGSLQKRHKAPKDFQLPLATRIKVMARLDIAEHRLPQDGRMKLRFGGRHVDFRVSTVPIVYGERIVLRILDKGNIVLGLDRLGLQTTMLNAFRKMIRMSEGIVLVTGPTGSGKTTTLYSAISEICSDEINVMTIEDPVEYKLPGIAQIGVNPKINLNFATGLRHILRQDPDVVLIGEIRDRETAEIAIQASLTGHLVLSTLHTNDAPSALTRLVDMEIEPFLLTSSVIGIVAQRLVRLICPCCSMPYSPSDAELEDLGLQRSDLVHGSLFSGTGCNDCFGTGYKGRHGIYELMALSGNLKRQLIKTPDATELRKIAISEGMVTLRKSGGILAAQGLTTTSEVLRVARSLEDG